MIDSAVSSSAMKSAMGMNNAMPKTRAAQPSRRWAPTRERSGACRAEHHDPESGIGRDPRV